MSRNWFFGLTSRVIMLAVAGLLVLSYASIVVNPAKVWLISLTGILFVPLSIINLILLLWAIKRRSKSLMIPLLALIPAFFFVGRYVQYETEEERAARSEYKEDALKIISYNVGRFALHDTDGVDSSKECADSIFEFIRRQDADIVCLQEFKIRDVSQTKSYLSKKLKGYKAEYYLFPATDGAFGNVTLSKLPVKGKGKIKFEESANLAIYTDYEHDGKTFRVYNCHFESYNISPTGIVKALAQRDSTILEETGTKMKRSITRRPKQVDKVFSDIENCSVDAFVCGDFNDNPMSYTYYRMTRERKDAFVEAGHGFGATYSFLWPLLRIDYILIPENYMSVSQKTTRIPYSDHYPVIAEISL